MKAVRVLPVILLLFSLAIAAAAVFTATWYIFVLIILVTLGIFVYGSAFIGSGFYIDVICHAADAPGHKRMPAPVPPNEIALTFDDGPDHETTPAILDILKKHNVKAAFFCTGKRILKNPDLLKRVDKEGHIIGNHSYSHHFLFDLFPGKQIADEIRVTGNLIYRNIKKRPLLFRPPFGVTNPVLARALKKTCHDVIGWSLKSRDTVIKDKDLLILRLKKKVKGGDIILFHDSQSHLPAVLDEFLIYASAKGFRAVRLDELLNIKAYE